LAWRPPSFGKTAYDWIRKIENAPRGRYVTLSLTVYETLVIIAGLTGEGLEDRQLVGGVVDSVTNLKGLVIEPLTPEDIIHTFELIKEYDIDYEDSLHLTTALRTGAKEIVSNDKDFGKTPLRRQFL